MGERRSRTTPSAVDSSAVTSSHRARITNIDGRPGDEILYPAQNQLVVITGDRTAGRVLWTWQNRSTLSMPAIADVDGDGLAEIVIQDALGTVHCLTDHPE